MPEVSIIIPTYNRVRFVGEAIESVLAQTFMDYELIIVDDGSTDDTKNILGKYGDRITCIFQDNEGVSLARNRGIKEATAGYLCFLDSDDLWMERKLEIQLDEMKKNSDFLISYTDEIWIRKGVRVNPKKKHRKYSGDLFEKSLELCIISPSSVMINRELLDKVGVFDEELEVCEDYDLWLRITKDFPVYFINQPLIVKRGGHSDQLSHKYWGNDRFRVRAIEKLLEKNMMTENQKRLAVYEMKKKCEILMQGFIKRKKSKEAEYYQSIINKWTNHEKNI